MKQLEEKHPLITHQPAGQLEELMLVTNDDGRRIQCMFPELSLHKMYKN